MKKLSYLLITLGCLACFSCYPDKCCIIPEPQNRIMAMRDSMAWRQYNVKGTLHLDTLIIADTSVNPQQSESIQFKLKFNGTNGYALTPANVVYGYVPQMDNPYVYYTLDTTYNNSFSVFFYDAPSGIIDGTFNIKLNKKPANTDSRYPQSVSFRRLIPLSIKQIIVFLRLEKYSYEPKDQDQ